MSGRVNVRYWAPKLSRISNRRPGLSGDIGLHVHGCQKWHAIHHADALKDVKRVLALHEEESIWSLLYREAPRK
jgi:hypothetical protein